MGGGDSVAVQLHGVVIQNTDPGAQLLQDGEEKRHIADLRDILNAAYAIHQKRGGNDGHGGVFRAADGDLAEQGTAAANNVLIQSGTLSVKNE